MHGHERFNSNASNLIMLKKRSEKSKQHLAMNDTIRYGSAAPLLCKTNKIRDIYGGSLKDEKQEPPQKVIRKK